jgi:hypothetical protein
LDAEVVIEATCGWHWAVDRLQDNGFNAHLARRTTLNRQPGPAHDDASAPAFPF